MRLGAGIQVGIKTLIMLAAAVACIVAPLSAASADGAGNRPDSPGELRSEAGVIHIQPGISAEGEEFIPLHGQWEFYWNELLEPGSFEAGTSLPSPVYLEVPGSWRSQLGAALGGPEAVKYGYGTYRLRMNLPPEDIGRSKALYVRSVGSAYRIWIDGQEWPGLGTVGKSREEETPQAHTKLLFFKPERASLELVVQVSNHSFREGGIINDVVYGDPGALIIYLLKKMFFDIFIIGGFALIGLYHLILHRFRRKNRLTLLVGLVALAMSMRTLLLNGYLSTLVFGINNWELITKLEYLSENLGFVFLVLLIKSMYPQEVNRYALYTACGAAAALSAFVLLTPARIFTETMMAQTMVKAVILIYFVFYIGVLAFVRKREGAYINMPAILLLIVAIVNDTLFYAMLADTVELFQFSFVLFLLAQAIIVSYRYELLTRRNDALVVELGEINATLEQRVQLRTQKLHAANEQLSEMKDIRTRMLVNIAHDLNSPLTGVQSYLHLMGKGALSVDRPEAARQMLEKTDYIQRLIRDVFELAKLESKEQSFELERVRADEWLDGIYGQFSEDLRREGVALRRGRWDIASDGSDGSDGVHVDIDRFRMVQVFQNYIDNAVKFSRDRSAPITVHAFTGQRGVDGAICLVVEIVDRGEGIAEEQLPHVFGRFYKKRTHNDEGSGLGLAIVAEIVRQHRGEVGVRSKQGEGSAFYFTLPVA